MMNGWKVVIVALAYVVPSVVVWLNGRATRSELRKGFDTLARKWE